jgi:hypothetical protein
MWRMARRARLVVALLLPLALLLFAAPATSGASCPTLLPKDVYRLGETLSFFGSYTDFADPGTVTIVFTRPADGLTRRFTAFNNPDGAWLRDVTFTRRSDVGSWRVRVTEAQTSGTTVCDDRFTLVAGSTPGRPTITPPPTDTAPFTRSTDLAPAQWLIALGVLLIGAAAAITVGVRRRA